MPRTASSWELWVFCPSDGQLTNTVMYVQRPGLPEWLDPFNSHLNEDKLPVKLDHKTTRPPIHKGSPP